jgi:mannose-6-phosphate isomerase-like protein (cupin superfamily)
VDFLHVTYEVGGASSPEREFQRHGGREWGYIISGSLRITVGFDEYVLGPGDAITLDSTIPHRLANQGPEPVHAVWFVLGRRRSDAGAG